MEKITIGIPIYNVEKYVERSILSALNQTYENIEVLIVDDKGNDNSMDIVRRIQSEHSKGDLIRIVEHPHNKGLAAVRNTIVDNAQGEYLIFLDSDDEITLNCLELHYNAAKEIDADFTMGGHMMVNEKNEKRDSSTNPKGRFFLETQKDIRDYFLTGDYKGAPPWNKLFKLSFLRNNQVRCIEHHINEDALFVFQIETSANIVNIFDDITYLYYQYDSSIMGKLKKGKDADRYAIYLYELIEYKLLRITDIDDRSHYSGVLNDLYRRFISISYNVKNNTSSFDNQILKKSYSLLSSAAKNVDIKKSTKIRSYLLANYPITMYRCFNKTIATLKK